MKLADLGLSAYIDVEREVCPTQLSPEILNTAEYSTKVDIWALGCLAIELTTGRPLFSQYKNQSDLFNAILNQEPNPIPNKWSSNIKDFINQCLNKVSNKRANI